MKNIVQLILIASILCLIACDQCEKITPKPCGGSSSNPKVDLVVLMDQSTSMNNESTAISQASSQAIENAKKQCQVDLRITYLGLDGARWPTTNFNVSHRVYLNNLNPPPSQFYSDIFGIGNPQERGASGIADLAVNFDWREEACRAIFYVSDEPIEGGTGNPINLENDAVDNAIEYALLNNVSVFTNMIDEGAITDMDNIDNYNRICSETFGQNFISNNVNVDTYLELMPIIICNSCNACTLNEFLK